MTDSGSECLLWCVRVVVVLLPSRRGTIILSEGWKGSATRVTIMISPVAMDEYLDLLAISRNWTQSSGRLEPFPIR